MADDYALRETEIERQRAARNRRCEVPGCPAAAEWHLWNDAVDINDAWDVCTAHVGASLLHWTWPHRPYHVYRLGAA